MGIYNSIFEFSLEDVRATVGNAAEVCMIAVRSGGLGSLYSNTPNVRTFST